MRSFVRESYKIGKNARLIRYYSSPSEYFAVKIAVFFLNLFVFWPIEIALFLTLLLFALIIDAILLGLKGVWTTIKGFFGLIGKAFKRKG